MCEHKQLPSIAFFCCTINNTSELFFSFFVLKKRLYIQLRWFVLIFLYDINIKNIFTVLLNFNLYLSLNYFVQLFIEKRKFKPNCGVPPKPKTFEQQQKNKHNFLKALSQNVTRANFLK